ncbi:MAG: urease accessory protein UreE [Alphaproteobacteria bacterium]|jgi:urease accessory protein|nr:urease accessory protein UreE [Alphaproteobacteria bacterium]MDP6517078.1 urease accessory protein UreE [Alphaproteobacteria bacterium]|tara:strand:+ start:94 stop:555 length:462 start_codon:yes stop_codon:yes gene_type:complete
MRRATKVIAAGDWPRAEARRTVTLDFDSRHRRRLRLTADDGEAVLLDLPEAAVLREGDGLEIEGSGWIEVRAAPESLLDITCADPRALVRVAWHLGNRHLPTQILEGRLRIRDDHVMAAMLTGLGARVESVTAPFDPESGAYQHEHGDGRDPE